MRKFNPDKLYTCKICKAKYKKSRPLQSVCGEISCAIAYSRKAKKTADEIQAKQDRKELREKKLSVKKLSWFAARAQKVFNEYIRLRDENHPCCSCDKDQYWQGQWHAGHLYTTAARSDIRFSEDNVHKQCSQCNNHLSGNVAQYKEKIRQRIGSERLDALEIVSQHKPTREYYELIYDEYSAKVRALKIYKKTCNNKTARA